MTHVLSPIISELDSEPVADRHDQDLYLKVLARMNERADAIELDIDTICSGHLPSLPDSKSIPSGPLSHGEAAPKG